MVSLKDLQRGMAEMILGQEPPSFLETEIGTDSLGALERLHIHKNTYRESLASALEGVFPLVGVLVGADFLRQVLQRFVVQNPPSQPMLYRYGEEFPAFLRTLEALEAMPYVADVADLEWHTHALMHSEEVMPDGITNRDKLCWNPNARFVSSTYPLFDLWRAATSQIEAEQVNIEQVSQSVLIVLHEGTVLYQPIEDADIIQVLAGMGREEMPDLAEHAMRSELIDRGALWCHDG